MNNKTRDIFIIILLISNIVLFFLYFQKNSVDKKDNHISGNNNAPILTQESIKSLPDTKIAFINIDTLNEKYLYISDYVKVMKKKKEALEAQLQSMMANFQQEYENFQQSAQAGIAPQAELEKQKRKLEQQQKDIQNKQAQMDNLALELQEKNEQLQRDIKEFLKTFNANKYDYILSYSEALPNVLLANDHFDITKEVLNALNQEYLAKKNQK